MLVLGIDGGGTKTLLALGNEHGNVLGTLELPSFALASYGEVGVESMFVEGVKKLLVEAGFAQGAGNEIDALCYGIPGWGESKMIEAAMTRIVKGVFAGTKALLCNDSQVAWAASLAMRPGINVVAGTGAIAFGMDAKGNTARCGGWGFTFSDEGSGYWLGRKMLELFCKQADGRIQPRGPLYQLTHEHFGTDDDFGIIETAEAEYLPHRDRIASLQRVLFQAALAGDISAVAMYREAGREIALNVRGVLRHLSFDGPVDVSYSGGIFNVGPLVMDSFAESLQDTGCVLCEPVAPPWVGSLMLALSLKEGDHSAAYRTLIEWTKRNKGANTCHL